MQQQDWSPYAMNGGYVRPYTVMACILCCTVHPTYCYHALPRTILAIAGDDFSVIASDSRLSEGFQIYSRDSPKTYQLYVPAISCPVYNHHTNHSTDLML